MPGRIELVAEFDRRLTEGVAFGVGVDDSFVEHPPSRVPVVFGEPPAVLEIGDPVLAGIDLVDPHREYVIVDRGDVEPVVGDDRVEGDELTSRWEERRVGVAHSDGSACVGSQLLAVDVGERLVDGDLVGGLADGATLDRDLVPAHSDACTGDRRFDRDLVGPEQLGIQWVAELEPELLAGPATIVVAAAGLEELEGAMGSTLVHRRVGVRLGAFGRGCAGADSQLERRVGVEVVDRAHGDPAFGKRPFGESADRVVLGDLVVGREPECHGGTVHGQRGHFEDGAGVDPLVELDEEDRGGRQGLVHGGHPADLGRRCAEFEAECLVEVTTGERGRVGGDLDDEVGCSRNAIDGARFVLEAHGTGAEPQPATRHLRSDRDRDVGPFDLIEGAERDHRLVEGDRDERRQIDRTLGLVAKDLERSGVVHLGLWGRSGGRKCLIERRPGTGPRPRLGRTEELDLVGLVRREVGQTAEQQRRIGRIERHAVHSRLAVDGAWTPSPVGLAQLDDDFGVATSRVAAFESHGRHARARLFVARPLVVVGAALTVIAILVDGVVVGDLLVGASAASRCEQRDHDEDGEEPEAARGT